MSDLYFNKESDYSEVNTSDNDDFRSTSLQPFPFLNRKKRVVMRAMRKKLQKQSYADILQNKCS